MPCIYLNNYEQRQFKSKLNLRFRESKMFTKCLTAAAAAAAAALEYIPIAFYSVIEQRQKNPTEFNKITFAMTTGKYINFVCGF